MKELLVFIAKSLVARPDLVEVTQQESDGVTYLRLKVGPEDVGKVIGKQGRIARSIRTLVKASSVVLEKRVNVEIV